MRIAHVTNFWPNRFGHAHYTQNLLDGIQKHRPAKQFIIGEGDTAAAENDSYKAIPCWSRGSEFIGPIVNGLREVGADVAYLQYSNDLFGEDNRFPRLVAAIERAGIRTIVVMHSVYPPGWKCGFEPGRRYIDFDRALGDAASCLHVHSSRMRLELVARRVPREKIAVIPHGSLAMETRDQAASRDELGIPRDARVVLFFGYIWLGKGVDGLLTSFKRLLRRVPNAFLYVGGFTRFKKWGLYVKYLQYRARLLGVGGHTKMWGDYVPDDVVPSLFSAADVVAMPYKQDYASVSGVVHQTAGMGKLMLCSRISKFDEVGELISPQLLVPPSDTRAWASRLERLLTDGAFADDMRARILRFGAETSWEQVARKHLEVCDSVVAGRAAGRAAAQSSLEAAV